MRVLGISLMLLLPTLVSAAGLIPIVPTKEQGSTCNDVGGCQSICDLALLAQNILNDGIFISVFLCAALFAWAGWKLMTAGGNIGEIKKAKSVFSSVFIGLIIILAAWLIVDTLMSTLLGKTPGIPWNKIC